MHSTILNILLLTGTIGVCSSATSEFYDKFRAIFGSVATLQPYDIDQITSQLLNQVNCTQYLGADCFNCLSSARLQASSLIGTTVNSFEFEKVSLIIFCYLLDINQFCYVNSIPDYGRCYNFITNSSNLITSTNLDDLLKNKIFPNYRVSNYFYPNSINSVKDKNCIDGKHLVKTYSSDSNEYVTGVEQLNGLASQLVFMMYNKMKIGCDLPYTNWFIDRIFSKNNTIVDYINLNDLRNLMSEMGLETNGNESKNKVSNTFRLVLFDQESNSNYANLTNTNMTVNRRNMLVEQQQQTRLRRDINFGRVSEYDKCYSVEQLKEIHSLTDTISRIDFHTLSPALIYMKLNGACARSTGKSFSFNSSAFSNAEKYGYGSTAIVFVSLIALVGVIVVPCLKKRIYESALIILTALAVGVLLSCALLHLLPRVLDIQSNETASLSSLPNFAFKVIGTMFAIYIFWIVQCILNQFTGTKIQLNSSNHSQCMFPEQRSTDNLTSKSETNDINATSVEPTEYYFSNKSKEISTDFSSIWNFNSLKVIKTAGWLILFADSIQNFTDGIIIGTSFSRSLNLGVSTSIAIFFYRIPNQLTNYTLLINSGFTHLQALVFNLLSTSGCLIGFFVSISLSFDSYICIWIFTIVTGMFIYKALIDLLPKVSNVSKWSWRKFILSNVALIFGFLVQFLLLIFEDQLKF